MKNLSYIILFLVPFFIVNTVYAKEIDNKRPSLEQMQAKKWDYIKSEAKLTDEETTQLYPIFSDYEKNIWELHESKRLSKGKNANQNYEELNENYIFLEVKQAELLKEYHLKLKQILSPERLFMYYHAERGFKRHLIFEMQDNRKHKGKTR